VLFRNLLRSELRNDEVFHRTGDKNVTSATVSRAAAREALQRHYNGIGMSKLGDLNVTCLSPTNRALLLYESLICESETVPEFFHSKQSESQLRADFAKDGFSDQFCSIDVCHSGTAQMTNGGLSFSPRLHE
jgi:hypothetical protein